MRIRKYNGKDMQEALSKVRSDLGVEAVILNSRKIRRRGIAAWFSKPYIEVLAAVEENFSPLPNSKPARKSHNYDTVETSRPIEAQRDVSSSRYGAAAYASSQANKPLPRNDARSADSVTQSHLEHSDMQSPQMSDTPYKKTPVRPDGEKNTAAHIGTEYQPKRERVDELFGIKEQIRSITSMLERMQPIHNADKNAENAQHIQLPSEADTVASDRSSNRISGAERFENITRRLKEQEIDADLADRVVGKVRGLLTPDAGEDEIRRQTSRVLAAALGEPETIRLRSDGKPEVVAFIGPTGVGKTTTLAKIAADFTLIKGKKVGLITADTYRIAAVEQLKTYAEILNLPVTVVYSPADMPAALVAHADKDLILIDTAGRSHRNRKQFDELRNILSSVHIDEVYLVLSVNTGLAACKEILEHYSFLKDYKLLFTKMDETPSSGVIFNARLRTGKPLSYVTAGQSVPDDLAVADPKAIAGAAAG